MTQVTDDDPEMPTSAELIEQHVSWVHSRYSEKTAEAARYLLTRVDRELPFGLPTALFEELEQWLSQPGWSTQTRATYRAHVCRFFAWATRPQAPRISCNPALALEPYRVRRGLPRPATDAQVRWCVTEARMPYRLFFRLIAYAGARPCEIARIAQDPHAHVTEQRVAVVHGKGDKDRSVKTHAMIWAVVRDLPTGPVASLPGGRPVTARWVSNSSNQYLHKTGPALVRGMAMYQLRHWYGTTMQARNRDLRVTQTAMGHASPATTQRYTLVTGDQVAEGIDALPSF